MNNHIAQRNGTNIVDMNDIDQATWNALKSSVFPGADENSIMMAIGYCQARGLDVLKKPVHIVPMKVKNAQTGRYDWRDVIMPGISEIRTTASRSGSYAGQDAPVFSEPSTLNIGGVNVNTPEMCTVTVYRMMNGERIPFSHTEYFVEACATKKEGQLNSMWSKRPRGQLAKCAEAGALRKAFPEEIGGEITADEVANDKESSNQNPVKIINQAPPELIERLEKAFASTEDDREVYFEKYQVTKFNELTEGQANAILQKKRYEYNLMKSDNDEKLKIGEEIEI